MTNNDTWHKLWVNYVQYAFQNSEAGNYRVKKVWKLYTTWSDVTVC